MNFLLMEILSGPEWLISILLFFLGIGIAVFIQQLTKKVKAKTFQEDLQRQIDGAKREADNIIKSARLDAASEAIKKKEELTAEANRTRNQLREAEQRLSKREDVLEKQIELVQQREKTAENLEKEVERRFERVAEKDKQLSNLLAQQKNQLLKITAMGVEDAKELLLKRLEDECEHEMATLIQRKVEEASETADEKSR
ncbi:MAG: Rnase Y domain-containing protein, partial [Phycisphaerales bacterium]